MGLASHAGSTGIIAIMLLVNMFVFGKRRRRKSWAAKANLEETSKEASIPTIALITPIVPTGLVIFFGWQTIPAFIVGALFALIVCGEFKNKEGDFSWSQMSRVISSSFYEGVIDVASLLGFLFILPMFNKISGVAAPFFEPILGGILPETTLGLAVAFMIMAPLGLFRGPLTVFGAGAATIGVLNALGNYPTTFMFTLMYTPTISMNLSACPTQSWNLWALNYSKVSVKEFMKTGVIWCWIITAINLGLIYVFFG